MPVIDKAVFAPGDPCIPTPHGRSCGFACEGGYDTSKGEVQCLNGEWNYVPRDGCFQNCESAFNNGKGFNNQKNIKGE